MSWRMGLTGLWMVLKMHSSYRLRVSELQDGKLSVPKPKIPCKRLLFFLPSACLQSGHPPRFTKTSMLSHAVTTNNWLSVITDTLATSGFYSFEVTVYTLKILARHCACMCQRLHGSSDTSVASKNRTFLCYDTHRFQTQMGVLSLQVSINSASSRPLSTEVY